jgi:catechol 2,3-dioxygenase-like lactoylglutathione lyase family enzyme
MKLNQVTLKARDVGACSEFYERLGFVLIVDSRPRYVRFECPDGGATFSVELADHDATGEGTEVYFECDDLDATVAGLARRGIEFEHGPRDQRWLWREARLRDPAGNRIVLFHAGDNRRFPPWRKDGLTAPAGGG